jgi:hypothetical protein
MKITRKDALKILLSVSDEHDSTWEYATEDYYDEENDELPSIYDVFGALGVTKKELDEAEGL